MQILRVSEEPLDSNPDDIRFNKDWIVGTLQPYKYYTVPDTTRPHDRLGFQLLSLEKRTVVTDTYQTRVDAETHVSFWAMIQPMEEFIDDDNADSALHAFTVEDPVKLDVIQLLGSDPDVRSRIRVWECGTSDIAECVKL